MNFYSSIAPYYDLLFPFDETQIQFLSKVIDPCLNGTKEIRLGGRPVTSLGYLDLGCGTGTILSNFTDRFHKLVGIDSDEELLKQAAEKMYPGEENKVELLAENILEINVFFREEQFSFISCLGNTLPHLTEMGQIPFLLKSVFECLEPGGIFVFQIINYDRILLKNSSELPTIIKGDITFERHYSALNTDGLIEFNTSLIDPEHDVELKNSVKLYPIQYARMRDYLSEAGFTAVDYYGDYDGSAYSNDSYLMIGVCHK